MRVKVSKNVEQGLGTFSAERAIKAAYLKFYVFETDIMFFNINSCIMHASP